MSDLTVRPVRSDAEYQAFLRMPWEVYRDDPCWTPPIWAEHVRFFDPAHAPELRHIDMEKFVAWRGDKAVGTIIAHVNHAYNTFHKTTTGWFGQFEVLDDPEAGDALLAAAEAWVKGQGMVAIMGPATFSTNSEIGMLVEGFEHPQMVMMPHARPYYRGFVEKRGYQTEMDLWAWHIDGAALGGEKADRLPEKITRLIERIKERKGFTVRTPDMRHLDAEIEIVKKVYNSAWEANWGFVPLDDAEIAHIAEGIKDILDPRIAVIIEANGEPVAFALPLPDVYEPLRLARCKPGEPQIFQLLRLLWHWRIRRRMTGVRVWGMGVLKEYRASGVDGVMYYEMMKRGLPLGYRRIEMSWILANNDMMNRGIASIGGKVYKTYRVFEKAL